MTPIQSATRFVAQRITRELIRTDQPLTYQACQQYLKRMGRGATATAEIGGMCNLRTLRTAVATSLTAAGRADLVAGPVRPTPQQLVWLRHVDDDVAALADTSGVTIRNCRDRGWTVWDGRRWTLTAAGRNAARGQGVYWTP